MTTTMTSIGNDGNHDNDDNDLDMSWINETKRIISIDANVVCEMMKHITVRFIYISVDNIAYGTETIQQPVSIQGTIERDQVIAMIQMHKIYKFHSHRLSDILVYNVDILSENIQTYHGSTSHLHILPIVDRIRLLPSLFIFHNINCIFVILREINKQDRITKPILKVVDSMGRISALPSSLPYIPPINTILHKKTKKVHFYPLTETSTTRKNKQ
jgi:hypothetical protein